MLRITKYLRHFGDLNKHQDEPDSSNWDGLRRLQRLGRLQERGIYDEATALLMALPRCPKHRREVMSAVGNSSDKIDGTFFVLEDVK